jgi:hypothetical protein
LLGDDGRSYTLWEGSNEPGTRWLDAQSVLVGLNGGFEVIGMDGRVLASHTVTGSRPTTGAGVASVTASPDGKRLAFLAWTTDIDLEVYLLDMETGESRAAGPASSFLRIVGKGTRVEASELHWSPDGSWLAWDWQTENYLQHSVYAHEVATAQTRLAADLMFFGFGDYPWLPDGNVLEYRMLPADSELYPNTFYALEADDLDSGQPWFVASYPMPPLAVTDSQSGQILTIDPEYFCNRTWLGNQNVFWNGCDGNTYLSRVSGQSLEDNRLIARGTAWLTLASRNRELFVLSPAYPDTLWQLYDLSVDRLMNINGKISSRFYTFLL